MMNQKITFCIQRSYCNSPEARAINKFALLHDHWIEIGNHVSNKNQIPVGSVEFCLHAMFEQDIEIPAPIDYPEELKDFLNRKLDAKTISSVRKGQWVKSILAKFFPAQICQKDGIVLDDDGKPLDSRLSEMSCWVSEPVKFKNEWRVYVANKKILGWSQYDDNLEDKNLSNKQLDYVISMIKAWKTSPAAYAIDVGTIKKKLSLVEVNDGWGTGFYKSSTMDEDSYARWIIAGWQGLSRIDKNV